MPKPAPLKLMDSLSPGDIAGRYLVVVRITPILPAQDMQRAQLAQAFRAPGVDHRPLMDDHTIREQILEVEHPELIDKRIDQQLLPTQSQEIAKIIGMADEWDWKQNNPETLKKAQQQQDDMMPSLTPEQMQSAMKLMLAHMQGQAPGLAGMVGATAPAGLPGGGPSGLTAPAVGPGGPLPGGPGPGGSPMMSGPSGAPPPSMMPSQTQMTPDQMQPNPTTLPAKQARRGKPKHKN